MLLFVVIYDYKLDGARVVYSILLLVPNPYGIGRYEPRRKLVSELEGHDLISSTNKLLAYVNSRHTWLAVQLLN